VHVLTKILVVFCAVLSLLLAALTMSYATNADRIKGSVESEKILRLASETTQRENVSSYASEKTKLQTDMQSLENDKQRLEQSLSTLRSEATGLRSQVETARAEADGIRNQVSQLGATTQTQAALIRNYREEVTKLRDDLVKASKREIELVDRMNELTGQREVLEQNARALKEQLEEAKISMQSSSSGTTGTPGLGMTGSSSGGMGMEPREFAGPLVRAVVTDVTTGPTGSLVTINEGANRGLKEGTLMHITRANDFVASIELIKVEPSTAVGRITLTSKGKTISRDDTVLSRLQ